MPARAKEDPYFQVVRVLRFRCRRSARTFARAGFPHAPRRSPGGIRKPGSRGGDHLGPEPSPENRREERGPPLAFARSRPASPLPSARSLFRFRHVAPRDRNGGDLPIASDQAPGTVSSVAAPGRPDRLCIGNYPVPNAPAWAPLSAWPSAQCAARRAHVQLTAPTENRSPARATRVAS
jgi:hypothetical protein